MKKIFPTLSIISLFCFSGDLNACNDFVIQIDFPPTAQDYLTLLKQSYNRSLKDLEQEHNIFKAEREKNRQEAIDLDGILLNLYIITPDHSGYNGLLKEISERITCAEREFKNIEPKLPSSALKNIFSTFVQKFKKIQPL